MPQRGQNQLDITKTVPSFEILIQTAWYKKLKIKAVTNVKMIDTVNERVRRYIRSLKKTVAKMKCPHFFFQTC
jgi:phage pi2 protein 07